MKFLFDHNLSPRLVERLADVFPQSLHVSSLGLEKESDRIVWTYAQSNAFEIITKDSDFNELVFLHGFPPKIIWLRLGNCSTREIEEALRKNADLIQQFLADSESGVLELQ
jgi:predicted nuclease of predicted toxin-antitoxin system